MALRVQKYGGTSVADIEHINNVAARVQKAFDQGDKIVVVLSAIVQFLCLVAQCGPVDVSMPNLHEPLSVPWSARQDPHADLPPPRSLPEGDHKGRPPRSPRQAA